MKRAERKGSGYGRILGLLLSVPMVTGGGTALGRPRGAAVGNPLPAVTVHVYNYAAVSDQTLEKGEKRAAHILRAAGIEVTWVNCNAATTDIRQDANCAPQAGPLSYDLRIAAHYRVRQGFNDGDSMGLAILPNLASVSFGRVAEIAKDAGVAPWELLGLAIAHEMGHLLLGSDSHSRTGIMRPNWGPDDYRRFAPDQWCFTPHQGEMIHRQIASAAQEQGIQKGAAGAFGVR